MLGNFGFVLALSFVALIIPLAAIVVGRLLAPRRPDPNKNSPYASAVETIGEAWVQLLAHYYPIGLIFLIFDVEVIFLFPIAVAFQQMSIFGVLATITFVSILALGLFFEWRKGSLEWS